MTSERVRLLKENRRLYEENRAEALFKQSYDNAISVLKKEIMDEVNENESTKPNGKFR